MLINSEIVSVPSPVRSGGKLCTYPPHLVSYVVHPLRNFRLTRLLALSQTLTLQASGKSRMRLLPEALTLTAGCVWLVNGLHARPEDGPASRKLMDAILPVTEAQGVSTEVLAYNTSVSANWAQEEEESDDGGARSPVPYNPYGCVFFRRMMIGDVPRLRIGGPVLPPPAFKFWFDGMSLPEIILKYQKSGIIDKAALVGKRITANKMKMVPYINTTGAPEPQLFNLAGRGHHLPPPSLDDGSDIDDARSDSPPPSLDDFLSQLWRQFVVDLTIKSPNPRGSTRRSYLKLTEVERRQGRDDIYKSSSLSHIFTDVAYRSASVADRKRAFKWLFPERGTLTSSSVQTTKCPYFRTWMDFANDSNHSTQFVKDVRSEIWSRLNEWSWIPDVQQDKMWPTKSLDAFTRWPNSTRTHGPIAPAPRILLKQGVIPLFIVEAVDNDAGEE